MKTKKYFGERPLDAPVPFGSMYRKSNKKRGLETKNRDSRSGYYPSPEQLAEYERICEGSAAHIIAMLDKDQMHRHAISQKSLKAKIFSHRLAMVLSAIVISTITSLGTYLAIAGYNTQSTILCVATIIAISATYKYNKNNSPKVSRPFNKHRNFKNKR